MNRLSDRGSIPLSSIKSAVIIHFRIVTALLFMGRIDPVEYVGVSQQRNGNVRNILEGDVNAIKRQLDIA